ncbi:hypothetical protein DFAR_1860023 [Desulfarculales bacterium]
MAPPYAVWVASSHRMISMGRHALFPALLLALALLAVYAGPTQAPPGVTMQEMNLVLYQGRWYEIASTRPWFQTGCACSRADYLLHGDELVIKNTCSQLAPNGQEYARTGASPGPSRARATPSSASAFTGPSGATTGSSTWTQIINGSWWAEP